MSDKNDKELLKILDRLRLRINSFSKGSLGNANLAGTVILAMREIEKLRLSGNRKKDCVIDLILLVCKEYGDDTLNVTVEIIGEIIEDLHSSNVVLKKKGCC